MCAAVHGKAPLWCRPLPPAPKQDPEASRGRVAPTQRPAVRAWVGRQGGGSWTAPEGQRGRTRREAGADPLPRKETEDCSLPSVCSSSQAAARGLGSRPRLQVPWCYRPEFNRTEGRQAWRLWGAWRKSERGISRARMRYTTALGPWWQGHTYWPPGRQHRGRGATVAGMGAPPDRGAALPRPASAPT